MKKEVEFIFSEIKALFEENSDTDNAIKMEAYMKGHFKMYGIKTPLRKDLLKPFYAEAKALSKPDLISLVNQLWNAEQRDYQYTAMEFLQRNKKKFVIDDIDFLERLLVTKSWWDSIDMLASHMIGHVFKMDIKIRDKWLEKWMASDNMWLQRTCLIFQLKYAKETDLDLLKSLILELKPINEFFVQKAIGWSLRQAARFYPADVIAFVEENEGLSNLAKREALKHFL